jgi:2-methylisocitrate lyase-like PEP mutase family enzyme
MNENIHPMIREHRIFVGAGVYDPLSAKLAQRAGFNSVILSGYAVAAAYLGEPDIGLLTQSEMLDVARRVCRAVDIGVIVDGDTGYGGVLNVQRMVRELIGMGARGILLEDQTWPKRCGHMQGKSVIPAEEHIQKIRAAREAKGDAPFLITARTDARAVLGLDEAIRRGSAYKEAGADLIFIEAPETVEEIERIAKEVQGPVVINMIEGGQTPILEIERLVELGYLSVGYVLSGLFGAAQALDSTYRKLLASGSSDGLDLMGFDEFTGLLGLPEHFETDERYRTPSAAI